MRQLTITDEEDRSDRISKLPMRQLTLEGLEKRHHKISKLPMRQLTGNNFLTVIGRFF